MKFEIKSNVLFIVVLLVFAGCSNDDNAAVEEYNWQITWQDEFDGPVGQLPDGTKWVHEIGRGPGGDGWGNQELQYYTDRSENASMDGNGNLAIIARQESFQGAAYTSARIRTKGLLERTYGRFEARIKMPWGQGIWPAFWMLGTNIDIVGWPQCGEIDIVEMRGQQPTKIAGSVHGPGYSGGSPLSAEYQLSNSRFDGDFHIFAVEWGEDYINHYVDNEPYQRIELKDVPGEWVFDSPFYMLLNVAVGGNYVGSPTNQTVFPQTMLVDWVRVFERVE